jgi:hypothetical protein
MKSLNVEILMGHDIGLANSYYKPSQQELLDEYIKSVGLLSIHQDKSKLEKQIKELKEKTEDSELIIESRLQQKDSEVLEWKKKYLKDMKGLIEQMNAIQEAQKETQKELSEIKRFRASLIRK